MRASLKRSSLGRRVGGGGAITDIDGGKGVGKTKEGGNSCFRKWVMRGASSYLITDLERMVEGEVEYLRGGGVLSLVRRNGPPLRKSRGWEVQMLYSTISERVLHDDAAVCG